MYEQKHIVGVQAVVIFWDLTETIVEDALGTVQRRKKIKVCFLKRPLFW